VSDNQIIELRKSNSALGTWVENLLVDSITGKDDEHTARQLRNEVRQFTAEVAGPNPTRIESVLAETAALSLVALRAYEARFTAAETKGGMTFTAARHHLRKIEHAQRRLESSLKTLATVRRLAIPAVQVNVAHNQQVNNQVVAGAAEPASGRM